MGNGGGDKIATNKCNNNKCVEAGKAGYMGADPPLLCEKESLERDFLQIYQSLYGLKGLHGEDAVKSTTQFWG